MLTPIDGAQLAGSQDGQQGDTIRNYGPISYGGALWAFPLMTNDASGDVDLNAKVYKSTDGGATWTQQDHAHAPLLWLPAAPYWDGVSSTVTLFAIAREPSSPGPATRTAVSLVDFSMASGTFGAPYGAANFDVAPSGATSGAPSADLRHASLFKLSNGTLRVVYTFWYTDTFVTHGGISSSQQAQVYYRDFAAGAWGARVVIPSQTTDWNILNDVSAAVQDGDVIHVVYGLQSILSTGSPNFYFSGCWYLQIALAGTFSTPVSLDALMEADGTTLWGVNTGIVSGNRLLVAVVKRSGGTPTVGVLIGTPKSAPVFSYVAIAAAPEGAVDIKMLHQAGKDTFAWITTNAVTSNSSLIYQASSRDAGATWTNPTLLLSLDATPPTPVAGKDTLNAYTVSLGALPDGSVGMLYTSWAGYLGADILPTIAGSDPQIMLRVSNDGGFTWGNERPTSMGKMGEFFKLVRWRRLGRSNDRAFQVICSEPVFVALISADLDVS
jgi:hypothetical protein